MKIFIIPHPTPFNFLYSCPRSEALAFQGLNAHKDVKLVDNPSEADYFILNHVPHAFGTKYLKDDILAYDSAKLIVLDYTDEWDRLLTDDYFMYFKRSWCGYSVHMNLIERFPAYEVTDSFYPIPYGILDEFPVGKNSYGGRKVGVGCYNRPDSVNRINILNYLTKLGKIWDGIHVGPVSAGSRSSGSAVTIDETYFAALQDTKILVHGCTDWIGDSRLAEALVSGCLVFTEPLPFPYPNPLEDGVHCVYYDPNDLAGLRRLLTYYQKNEVEAEKIATAGQAHALTFYTSKSIIEYVVERIHWKEKSSELAGR